MGVVIKEISKEENKGKRKPRLMIDEVILGN